MNDTTGHLTGDGMSHTPAPWIAGKPQWRRGGPPYRVPITAATGTVANVLSHESVQWYPPEQCDPQPNADAKLVAASPELFELVVRCYRALHRDEWEDGETESELMDRINDTMHSHFGDAWRTRVER